MNVTVTSIAYHMDVPIKRVFDYILFLLFLFYISKNPFQVQHLYFLTYIRNMWFTYSYEIASQIDIIFHFYVYLSRE